MHALRIRISETSVRAAAGWSNAMVVRHTSALSGELAVEGFRRNWIIKTLSERQRYSPRRMCASTCRLEDFFNLAEGF